MARISLIEFRTFSLERTADFYRALGLTLVPERHGNGLRHYSMTIGEMVVELYPKPHTGKFAYSGTVDVTVTVEVDFIDETLLQLWKEYFIVDPQTAFGPNRVAIVVDPDGRRVRLIEK